MEIVPAESRTSSCVFTMGAQLTEHYTRNTTEATAWCKKCNRMTQYRVDSGRRGPCLEHQTPVKAKIPPFKPAKDAQKKLFEE